MKAPTLIIIFTFISLALGAFPCTKYVIDFEGRAMPGKLKISWSINTGCNNCGFPADEVSKHRFIVKMEGVLDNFLVTDTVSQNYFVVNTFLTGHAPFVFSIEELGSSEHAKSILIKMEEEKMSQCSSKADTLNFYLLNGYFYNAAYAADKVERPGLLDEIKKEYKILFPDHYPDEQTYFNSYLDPNAMTLVRMPAVQGLSEFVKAINKLTKDEPKRHHGFKVSATISAEGELIDYHVSPESDKQVVEKATHHVSFSDSPRPVNPVVIIIGRTKNNKRFTLVNGRALMDQRSPDFIRRFPYRGPVH